MDWLTTLYALAKEVAPAVAVVVTGISAVAHYFIARKHQDHHIALDDAAADLRDIAAKLNPASQRQIFDAGGTP